MKNQDLYIFLFSYETTLFAHIGKERSEFSTFPSSNMGEGVFLQEAGKGTDVFYCSFPLFPLPFSLQMPRSLGDEGIKPLLLLDLRFYFPSVSGSEGKFQ
ncbi:MAG: hypothetical protein RM368_16740 [Nostoc sp. DedSLP03]|nr:hypothetical protein [Nostoc sp. DedSLP03]